MPRKLLVFITSIIASALAFATAASAPDYGVQVEQQTGYAPEQEPVYAVDVQERVVVVEEDDSLVDIDVFDDDDDEARVISSYGAVPSQAMPY